MNFWTALLFGFILFAPCALFAFGMIDGLRLAAGLIAAIYLSILMINFEVGFLTLIFIRSSLDYVKQIGGVGGFNVAAAVSIAMIVLGVFYILYRKIDIFRYEDTGPFLLFLAVCGASIFFSQDQELSGGDLLRQLSVFFIYLLTRDIAQGEEKIRQFLLVVLSSALVPVIVAYYQLLSGNLFYGDFEAGRLIGTFYHPNAFASYLVVILIFSTALVLEKEPLLPRLFLVPFVGLTSLVLVLTYSRGAWIVFLFSMMVMGALRYRKIFALIPIGVVLAVACIPAIRERVIDALDPSYSRGHSAVEWRVRAWADLWQLVKHRPFFGHGLSMVEVELGYLAHNDYLRLLAEVGIVGFSAYVFMMWSVLTRTWRTFRRHHDGLVKAMQVGLVAAILGVVLRQSADNTLRNTVGMMYFWIFVAVARNIADARISVPPRRGARWIPQQPAALVQERPA